MNSLKHTPDVMFLVDNSLVCQPNNRPRDKMPSLEESEGRLEEFTENQQKVWVLLAFLSELYTILSKHLPGNIKGYFDSGQMRGFFSPCSLSLCILFRQR